MGHTAESSQSASDMKNLAKGGDSVVSQSLLRPQEISFTTETIQGGRVRATNTVTKAKNGRSYFSTAIKILRNLIPSLLELYEASMHNSNYFETIPKFVNDINKASVGEKARLLKSKFKSLGNGRIKRTRQEWKAWLEAFYGLMNLADADKCENLRIETTMMFSLSNLILKALKDKTQSERLQSMPDMLSLQRNLFRRIKLRQHLRSETEYEGIKWANESAKAIKYKLERTSFIRPTFILVQKLANTPVSEAEFQKAFDRLVELAQRSSDGTAEDKVAATTALLYIHQSIQSEKGLQLGLMQAKYVRDVLFAMAQNRGDAGGLLIPNFEGVLREVQKSLTHRFPSERQEMNLSKKY
ncbi:hypothetical protein O181_005338 [Austropuccinia psidii MF-1]|uniref:Uncharacterized protein n=1 Tax=Austropuccinia psidii MF-1 TaxID=1389203 RepID=A0A9Q3GFF5_9BASI|nr:hypothetical protein [Austropuccinia psidii MF-1]